MNEHSDVSSKNIQYLLKKYSSKGNEGVNGVDEVDNTGKRNDGHTEEPMSFKLEPSPQLVNGINFPPTPSPTNFLSNSQSSTSTLSNQSSCSSLSIPHMVKSERKPQIPSYCRLTPRAPNMRLNHCKITKFEKAVQTNFCQDENKAPESNVEEETYKQENVKLKKKINDQVAQIAKLVKENEYIEKQFRKLQADSSAKAVFKMAKISSSESEQKIIDLQNENEYLVNQVKKMQAESSANAVLPASQYQSDVIEKVTICNKKYDVWKKPIGKGASCHVFKGFYNEMVAIKVVSLQKLNPKNKEEMEREIHLLRTLKNEDYIINLLEYELVKDRGRLNIVLEYGETDLHTYLQNTTCLRDTPNKEKYYEALVLWHQMLAAVQCIHSHKIIHKDLKPQNFMKVKGKVKLIDFGISQTVADADITSMIIQQPEGTPNYIAPEMLSGTFGAAESNILGYRSDVYSLGCILYKICFGCTPYQHINKMQMKYMAIISPEPVKIPALSYPDIVKILEMSLNKDRSKRPTVAQLIDM